MATQNRQEDHGLVTVVLYAVGASIDQYIEACRILGVTQSNVPDGLILHTASTTDEGFLVLDVWESRKKFMAFQDRLHPVMVDVGLGSVEPKYYPTHFVMGSYAVPPMDPLKTNIFSD
ncbi:MAG: hypothetical protein HONBIEJF_00986 [Fimbriimonadaceae bacterium]|nr:hypothetical protein [Fimbriimonadaceae bacterium]